MKQQSLCVIPGDGVGREVVPAAVSVLQAVLPGLIVTEADAGWAVFEATSTALPSKTLAVARDAGAVLFGAVSSPSHAVEGYRSPIVAMRRALDTFANIRPAKTWLRDSALDMLIVRENTEGLYIGDETTETLPDGGQRVVSRRVISQAGTARIARVAFDIAAKTQRRVTIVHKANVVRQGDGLWRQTCLDVAADFPSVAFDEVLVDAAAYHMARTTDKYQLLLCPNLYGDILSDLASGLADGLGMAPSLSLGQQYAIAEPVHGSAPDIARQGIANPIAAILSAAMLCRYWWQRLDAADAIEKAVAHVLASGVRTPDMGHQSGVDVGTSEMAQAILDALSE